MLFCSLLNRSLTDTVALNACMVAEPVPSWQRFLWNYAFLGSIVRGKMKQMMNINAEKVPHLKLSNLLNVIKLERRALQRWKQCDPNLNS
jgi:hypothetical protein